MKKILTTILLVLTFCLTPSFASSQDTTETVEFCYDTSVKIISKKKKDKVKKAKKKENCFEITDDGKLIMTDHKGREEVYHMDVENSGLVFTGTGSGVGIMVEAYKDGKNYKILIDYYMMFVAIHDVKKDKTVWYYNDSDESSELKKSESMFESKK